MKPDVSALLAPVTPGIAALIAAIALALIAGVGWRVTNGKMRTAGRPGSAHDLRVAEAVTSHAPDPGSAVTSEQLGHPLGERATLLQFSSAFCAPCRATRRILADVAGMTQGVAHIEIDAESHLDLVRALNVLRTPTVLVLAADGQIVRRASGQPRKPDVIAALGAALEP